MILPKDVPIVKNIFEEVPTGHNVFSKDEMNNKINLHALRREHANDVYQFFENIILTVNGFARSLRERLIKMFERGNYDLYKANPQKYEAKLKRFIDDMNDTPYELRGENKKELSKMGNPLSIIV